MIFIRLNLEEYLEQMRHNLNIKIESMILSNPHYNN